MKKKLTYILQITFNSTMQNHIQNIHFLPNIVRSWWLYVLYHHCNTRRELLFLRVTPVNNSTAGGKLRPTSECLCVSKPKDRCTRLSDWTRQTPKLKRTIWCFGSLVVFWCRQPSLSLPVVSFFRTWPLSISATQTWLRAKSTSPNAGSSSTSWTACGASSKCKSQSVQLPRDVEHFLKRTNLPL